jgi:hypothetical protein
MKNKSNKITSLESPPVNVLEDERVDLADLRHELNTHRQVLQQQQQQQQQQQAFTADRAAQLAQ